MCPFLTFLQIYKIEVIEVLICRTLSKNVITDPSERVTPLALMVHFLNIHLNHNVKLHVSYSFNYSLVSFYYVQVCYIINIHHFSSCLLKRPWTTIVFEFEEESIADNLQSFNLCEILTCLNYSGPPVCFITTKSKWKFQSILEWVDFSHPSSFLVHQKSPSLTTVKFIWAYFETVQVFFFFCVHIVRSQTEKLWWHG